MGQSTVLFVTAKKEALLDMMPKVIHSLNSYIRKELDQHVKIEGYADRCTYLLATKENNDLPKFSNGTRGVNTYDFRIFSISFTIASENRILHVTHDCSSDYSDVYSGDKIIFSLGAWGRSVDLMMVIYDVLKDYGDVYLNRNDCSGDFELIKQ